uniref:Uncharacterized protein n=1 Tax=Rhizophora mucronata TaxID=61149 RepID=A0A2P2MY27_RHIMU
MINTQKLHHRKNVDFPDRSISLMIVIYTPLMCFSKFKWLFDILTCFNCMLIHSLAYLVKLIFDMIFQAFTSVSCICYDHFD